MQALTINGRGQGDVTLYIRMQLLIVSGLSASL